MKHGKDEPQDQRQDGPFASSSLCNARLMGSQWMLEFRTCGRVHSDGRKALIAIATIDGLQENSQGHTLVHVHTPMEWGVKLHDCYARTLIAMHPYDLMQDRYELGMVRADQQRLAQEAAPCG